MAIAYTVSGNATAGHQRRVWGTFTSAAGDSGGTLGESTHGLNYIADYDLKLDTGGVETPNPKVTVSSGTLTWVVADTLGYSGKWTVTGS